MMVMMVMVMVMVMMGLAPPPRAFELRCPDVRNNITSGETAAGSLTLSAAVAKHAGRNRTLIKMNMVTVTVMVIVMVMVVEWWWWWW